MYSTAIMQNLYKEFENKPPQLSKDLRLHRKMICIEISPTKYTIWNGYILCLKTL